MRESILSFTNGIQLCKPASIRKQLHYIYYFKCQRKIAGTRFICLIIAILNIYNLFLVVVPLSYFIT